MEKKVENKLINEFLKERFPAAEINDRGGISVYSSVEKEYYTLKNGVGIKNSSGKLFLKLSGKDVLDFIHRISTNNINSLNVNEKIETLFTNDKGRIIDKATMMRFDYNFMLVGSPDENARLYRWVDRYIISEDINIGHEDDNFLFEVCGPQAESYLTLICGKFIDALDNKRIVNVNIEGLIFKIIKNEFPNGLTNYWLFGEASVGVKLIEYLLNHVSVFEVQMVGEKAHDIFRIENGIPVFPNELNDNYNPNELNLLHLVDFNKGCFIGQEVIMRLDSYDKVQRELVGVIFESEPVNGEFDVTNSGEIIGEITSTAYSHKLKKNIGLALIRKKYAISGEKYLAKNDKERIGIKITGLPFSK